MYLKCSFSVNATLIIVNELMHVFVSSMQYAVCTNSQKKRSNSNAESIQKKNPLYIAVSVDYMMYVYCVCMPNLCLFLYTALCTLCIVNTIHLFQLCE